MSVNDVVWSLVLLRCRTYGRSYLTISVFGVQHSICVKLFTIFQSECFDTSSINFIYSISQPLQTRIICTFFWRCLKKYVYLYLVHLYFKKQLSSVKMTVSKSSFLCAVNRPLFGFYSVVTPDLSSPQILNNCRLTVHFDT
jgi:hypothetical protein